jgi:hypothetical protein
LVQTSSGAVIFTPHSLSANGQLNHIHNKPPSYLTLQYDQAAAMLPIIQQKYSNIVDIFLILFVVLNPASLVFLSTHPPSCKLQASKLTTKSYWKRDDLQHDGG